MEASTTPATGTRMGQAAESSIRNLPVNLFASVMGTAGLALSWRLAHASFGAPAWIGEALGALAVLAFIALSLGYLGKWSLYPQAVKAEFLHPVAGHFFGTITISLLLLSVLLMPYSEALGQAVWALGVVSTLALGGVVVARLLKGEGQPGNTVPAWLIPGVASLDIAVAGANMPMAWAPEVNLLAVAVGSVLALLFLTLITLRLIQHQPLPLGITPSLLILVAPFEVGFLAYTNLVGDIDRFAALLFYFGLFMFVVLCPKVFRREVTRIPFATPWWAISFPVAALTLAALKYASARATLPLTLLAALLLAFLSVAIAVLALRTLQMVFSGRLLRA